MAEAVVQMPPGVPSELEPEAWREDSLSTVCSQPEAPVAAEAVSAMGRCVAMR